MRAGNGLFSGAGLPQRRSHPITVTRNHASNEIAGSKATVIEVFTGETFDTNVFASVNTAPAPTSLPAEKKRCDLSSCPVVTNVDRRRFG
jgi:hypothetical protein